MNKKKLKRKVAAFLGVPQGDIDRMLISKDHVLVDFFDVDIQQFNAGTPHNHFDSRMVCFSNFCVPFDKLGIQKQN